jgi:hypothetical protein
VFPIDTLLLEPVKYIIEDVSRIIFLLPVFNDENALPALIAVPAEPALVAVVAEPATPALIAVPAEPALVAVVALPEKVVAVIVFPVAEIPDST